MVTHTQPLGQGVGEGVGVAVAVAVGVALGVAVGVAVAVAVAVGVGVGVTPLTWKLSVLLFLLSNLKSLLPQTFYSPPGFGVSSNRGVVKPLEPVFRIDVS